MILGRPPSHADYTDRPIPRQSVPSAWIERAGTARLSLDTAGTLFITCTVHDERFARELTAIPVGEYSADAATTNVVVSSAYAPIARVLAQRYFADIDER